MGSQGVSPPSTSPPLKSFDDSRGYLFFFLDFFNFSSCKNYRLVNFFPARAIALGCLFVALQERKLAIVEGRGEWIEHISGRKVDLEDFVEIVRTLQCAND